MFRATERVSVMSTTDQSRDVVLRYVQALNAADLEAALAQCAEGLVNHAAIPEAQGRDGLRVIFSKLRRAFPDARFDVKDVIAENDRVVVRGVMTGTNTGDITFVRLPMRATGRRVEVEHLHVFRVHGDKIVEHWACRDDFALLRQLGAGEAA